jgi:hypothetical protein
MRIPPSFAFVMAAATLAACGDTPPPAPTGADPRVQAAREAAEPVLRERLRSMSGVHLRGVQVFPQANPNTFAVCGRASASASMSEPLLPWVAVVTVETSTAQVTSLVVGASGAEATRVFVELVERCFEGGGPANSRMAPRPPPPLPMPVAAGPSMLPASTPQPAETPTGAAAAQPGPRSVVTSARSGANLRAAPQGGEVLRVVPRSTTLQVFAEAPGGWYQVGQSGAAWGWLHLSVLEEPAR